MSSAETPAFTDRTPLESNSDVPAPPLYADLDGTIIASDLTWESILLLIRRDPLAAVRLPIWLARGRAHLKAQLAKRVEIDVESLPYRAEVIAHLHSCKASGQSIALATASATQPAAQIAELLGLFNDVIATDGAVNRKGKAKLQAIRDHLGSTSAPFDYVGDSRADIPLWRAARHAVLANASPRLVRAIKAAGKEPLILVPSRAGWKPYLRAMRPHQWAKNILIFLPLIAHHAITDPTYLVPALAAFIGFCLTASGVYVLNDLLDLPSDRRHPKKRARPFASGQITIPHGLVFALGLFLAAACVAWFLPWRFSLLLGAYVVLTTAYSLVLKQKLGIDVLCLAALYTLRILAGGAASSIIISPWLMAFSMFFFLSLAFAKRYTELDSVHSGPGKVPGRGYLPADIELVRSLGPTSGYLSALVLCLYINSVDVIRLYHRPWVLWAICPLLLYWITRLWFLAQRQQLPDDPVLFAVRDRNSYVVGLIAAVILALAKI